MLLQAMTLCNSVVPSSDVFNLLVRPRANATDAFSPAARDRSRRSSQDSPPNSPPPLSRSVDEEDLSVDDFISCPVPEHVAEERLWAEQLCWNDMVLGTLTYVFLRLKRRHTAHTFRVFFFCFKAIKHNIQKKSALSLPRV